MLVSTFAKHTRTMRLCLSVVIGLASAHVQGSFKIEYKARAMFVDQTLGISSVYTP